MFYIPQAQYQVYAPVRAFYQILWTQLPGVGLDAACDSEVVLRIPFSNPANYFDLTTLKFQMGKVYINVYSQLQYGTGSPDAEVTVWLHWEDVVLHGPTNAEMDMSHDTVRRIQKGRKLKQNAADVEQSGQLSSALSKLSTGVSAFSFVPMIGDFMKSGSWVLDAAAGVARSFGFSKPTDARPPNKMLIIRNAMNQNCDVEDFAQKLALSGKNQLTPYSASGDGIDVMSIKYIAAIPAQWSTQNWSVSQGVDTLITLSDTQPASYVQFIGSPPSRRILMPPWVYCTFPFMYWRGDIVITIRVVKSQFHTGRLQFTFTPGYHGASTPPANIYNSSGVFREILDISCGSEWSFTIPYMAATPWLRTNEFYQGQTTNDPYGYGYGEWELRVLNPLKAPDTVANNVAIQLETSCHNLHVSGPKARNHFAPLLSPAQAQGDMDDCLIKTSCIGSSNTVDPGSSIYEYCSGEAIVSIRQLIKRYTKCNVFKLDDGDVTSFPAYLFGCAIFDGSVGGAVTVMDNAEDMLSYWAYCFAYNRGSIRYNMQITETGAPGEMGFNYTPTNYPVTRNVNFAQYGMQMVSPTFVYDSTSGPITIVSSTYQFETPPYNSLHTRLNLYTTTNTETEDVVQTEYDQGVALYKPDGFNVRWYSRAAGEDFQFDYFLSTMPILF